jgi:hypothetical protein
MQQSAGIVISPRGSIAESSGNQTWIMCRSYVCLGIPPFLSIKLFFTSMTIVCMLLTVYYLKNL